MVRDATLEDIPQLCGLISDFYADSDYNAPLINPEKTKFILEAYINADPSQAFIQVVDAGRMLVGFMIGERVQDLWSDATRTLEVAVYVNPAYRGKPGAGRLLLNFKTWAEDWDKSLNLIRVEASSGIRNDKAAEIWSKMGYNHRGTLHGAEI